MMRFAALAQVWNWHNSDLAQCPLSVRYLALSGLRPKSLTRAEWTLPTMFVVKDPRP
jgi:hypothetical protein